MHLPRFRYASLALTILLLLGHVTFEDALSYLRGKTFDAYQTISPRPAIESPVVLVVIDDASLAKYGRWPWNRGVVANLVSGLRHAGAAVIGLDLLFPEPDTGVDGAKGDAALAAALAQSRSLLAMSLSVEISDTKITPKVGITPLGSVPDSLSGVSGVISSLPILSKAASGL